MGKKSVRPRSEALLPAWFGKLSTGVGRYGATLGLSVAEVADVQANCAFGIDVLRVQGIVGVYAQGITRFKNAALWATEQCTEWPAGLVMPADLAAVSHAGVVPLLQLVIQRMKKHPAYTKQMGEEVGIEGADSVLTPEEMAAMKPQLKIILEAGGHPLVKWTKGEMDGLEIWVDRGDGKGSVFTDIDNKPDYLDPFPLPAVGTSAVWKYKAIYRIAGYTDGLVGASPECEVLLPEFDSGLEFCDDEDKPEDWLMDAGVAGGVTWDGTFHRDLARFPGAPGTARPDLFWSSYFKPGTAPGMKAGYWINFGAGWSHLHNDDPAQILTGASQKLFHDPDTGDWKLVIQATKFVTLEIIDVWTGTKQGGDDPTGIYTRESGLDPVATLTVEPVS